MSIITDFLENSRKKVEEAKDILNKEIENIKSSLPQATSGKQVYFNDYVTPEQARMAELIFGDSINFNEVIFNDTSFMADVNQHYQDNGSRPFVLGNTINSNKPLSTASMMHELMHIHQYQTEGWRYALDALAHNDPSEYVFTFDDITRNNGNPMGERLGAFNHEQQGNLVKDYYYLIEGNIDTNGNIQLTNGKSVPAADVQDMIDNYQPYIDEIQNQTPIEGAHKEINEMGEEVAREVGEMGEEITREAANGNIPGVLTETIEGGGEIIKEGAEGVAETTWEVTKDGATYVRDTAGNLYNSGGEIVGNVKDGLFDMGSDFIDFVTPDISFPKFGG